MPEDWWPAWYGEVVCICGSGPSLAREDVDVCRGRRVIVINETWQIAPWADVLYACDAMWLQFRDFVPEFPGLKVCRDNRAQTLPGVHHIPHVKVDQFFYDRRRIGWGGNSGFQAVNLAIQFSARRIALLGFDMHLDGGSHWHGDHPKGLPNPKRGDVDRWRRALDSQAPEVRRRGIEIVNCTPGSALEAYVKMPIGEALARWA